MDRGAGAMRWPGRFWKRASDRRGGMRRAGSEQSRVVGKATLGVQNGDPRSPSIGLAPLQFLVGEAGQSPQVAPISAGWIGLVGLGQAPGDPGGKLRRNRLAADSNPCLKMTRTGGNHQAGGLLGGAHGIDHARVGTVEIHQDKAGIAMLGIGPQINVVAAPIGPTEEFHGADVQDLGGGPKTSARPRLVRGVMNQPNFIAGPGHGSELPPHGGKGNSKSRINHGIKGRRLTDADNSLANKSGQLDMLTTTR